MSELTIRDAAVDLILDEVESRGAIPVETGAFLLAREHTPDEISLVALPGSEGVLRHRHLFEISGEAMAELFDMATENDLVIRAQIHSHRRAAFPLRTGRKLEIRDRRPQSLTAGVLAPRVRGAQP